jgi:hypothetical protein
MAERIRRKKIQPFSRRVLMPAGIALGAWVTLNVLTSHLEWFGSGQTYQTAADILYSMLGFTLIFSSLIIYSLLYVQGGSTIERILWANIVPLAWILKEIWRVSAFFTWGESFYYALSPMPLGLLLVQLLYLTLGELFWRWRDKKKNEVTRILTSGPVSVLMIFVVLVYFMLFWGNAGDTPGSKLFYIYMEGYKALFVN